MGRCACGWSATAAEAPPTPDVTPWPPGCGCCRACGRGRGGAADVAPGRCALTSTQPLSSASSALPRPPRPRRHAVSRRRGRARRVAVLHAAGLSRCWGAGALLPDSRAACRAAPLRPGPGHAAPEAGTRTGRPKSGGCARVCAQNHPAEDRARSEGARGAVRPRSAPRATAADSRQPQPHTGRVRAQQRPAGGRKGEEGGRGGGCGGERRPERGAAAAAVAARPRQLGNRAPPAAGAGAAAAAGLQRRSLHAGWPEREAAGGRGRGGRPAERVRRAASLHRRPQVLLLRVRSRAAGRASAAGPESQTSSRPTQANKPRSRSLSPPRRCVPTHKAGARARLLLLEPKVRLHDLHSLLVDVVVGVRLQLLDLLQALGLD